MNRNKCNTLSLSLKDAEPVRKDFFTVVYQICLVTLFTLITLRSTFHSEGAFLIERLRKKSQSFY